MERVFNGRHGTIIHYDDAKDDVLLYVKEPRDEQGRGKEGISLPKADLIEFLLQTAPSHFRFTYSLRNKVVEAERDALIEALLAHNGNRTRTARAMNISRRTLLLRIKALKIDVPSHRYWNQEAT